MFALLLVTFVACRGGNDRDTDSGTDADLNGDTDDETDESLTNGHMCNLTGEAHCEWQIRCGDWLGTQADCEIAREYECCEAVDCSLPALGDETQLEACNANLRGLPCENPLPSVCTDLLALSESSMYEACESGEQCPDGAMCLPIGNPEGTHGCTLLCGPDHDTCSPDGICIEYGVDTIPTVCHRFCPCPDGFLCYEKHDVCVSEY